MPRLQITEPGSVLPVLIDRLITADQANQIIALVGGQTVSPLRATAQEDIEPSDAYQDFLAEERERTCRKCGEPLGPDDALSDDGGAHYTC